MVSELHCNLKSNNNSIHEHNMPTLTKIDN